MKRAQSGSDKAPAQNDTGRGDLDRADALARSGHQQDAEAIYRRVLRTTPDSVRANHALAFLLIGRDLPAEALGFAERAATLAPGSAGAHLNHGAVLRRLGRLDQSIAATHRARALQPGAAEAHYNLANTVEEHAAAAGQVAAGVALQDGFVASGYRCALALRPTYLKALFQLARLLVRQNKLAEGIALLERASALDPANAALHGERANILRQLDRFDAAEASYQRAVALDPSSAPTLFNHGNLRLALADPLGAIARYDLAIAINAEDPEYHWNRALALLTAGRFADGWQEYEWRWRWSGFSSVRREFTEPPWEGSALAGRTILLHAEQGLGDTIQFIRFAPLLRAAGARVIVECQPELLRTLSAASDIDEIVAAGSTLPSFDVHAPLLSVPRLLGIHLGNIPATSPYLRTAGTFRLAEPRRLNVGIQWAGNPRHAKDRLRSVAVEGFRILTGLPGVRIYSLQVGPRPDELAAGLAAAGIVDLAPQLHDLADTAAAIAALDLVISVDTAVAHLAGALGREVWTLLAYSADWRWLTGRDDSPWYPTMRLFRQTEPGNWEDVFRRVAAALTARASGEARHMR